MRDTKSIKTIPCGVNGALFRACQQRKDGPKYCKKNVKCEHPSTAHFP